MVDEHPRSGRPRKTTRREDSLIAHCAKRNLFGTSARILDELNFGHHISLRHRRTWWNWSCDHLRWNFSNWSDESRFLLCSVDDRVRVWWHINTAFHDRNMIGTTAFGGGSVTVWGAFLVHFIFCNCKLDLHALQGKKSLKIPNGQSQSVYRRRTDNTITNRNSTKGQATIYKTYT
jgi:hypothetical protein